MISVDALWALLERTTAPLPARSLPLEAAGGLTLAEALLAVSDQPEFDRSAMDGYAIGANEGNGEYLLLGTILPGEAAPRSPGRAEAWRVYTGSALPPGVRVVKQEETTATQGGVNIESHDRADYVRRKGSAIRQGEVLLNAGARLTPARLAIAAGAGWTRPIVIPRPQVLHLTTGSEIVPPDQTPGPGQIRDTNGPLMAALVAEAGGALLGRRHASESIDEGEAALRAAGEALADLLLISGGASVGDFDGSAALLERLGFTLICRQVASRPGKPLLVGVRGGQIAFGLPGNSVSHFVTFHLFVKRVLDAFLGRKHDALPKARLSPGAPLRTDPRETFWPARLHAAEGDVRLEPLPWLDSGHLAALAGVNALLRLRAGAALPAPDEGVEFIPCGPMIS